MSEFLLAILVGGFAPGLFWLWWIYRQDRYEPEPLKDVRQMFIHGMWLPIPILFLSFCMTSALTYGILHVEALSQHQGLLLPLVSPVFTAPVIEELCKFWALLRFGSSRPALNEPVDGVVYAAAVALGFASVENVLYLMSNHEQLSYVFTLRMMLSVPAHALFASFYGYSVGLAKMDPQWPSGKMLFRSVLMAVGCHSLFNLLAHFSLIGALAMIGLVGWMWKRMFRDIEAALSYSRFLHED